MTFSLKYLFFRKKTIDNSVRYVNKDSKSQSEQTRDIKPNTEMKSSLPRKQGKKLSQKNSLLVALDYLIE